MCPQKGAPDSGSDSPGEVLCYIVDLTEQTLAREQLRESERRYSALFANRFSAIAHCRVITDERGKPFDYEIIQVNPAYESITGISKSEIEGKTARQAFPGIESFSFDYISKYGSIAQDGGELAVEDFFESMQRWFSIYAFSPKRGEFVAMFTDITDRKRAEHAMRESERRYRALFESMQEGLSWLRSSVTRQANPRIGVTWT